MTLDPELCMECGPPTPLQLCSRCTSGRRHVHPWVEMAKAAHANAVEKGFHEEGATRKRMPTLAMLIVTELAEAFEELRAGRGLAEVYYHPERPDKPEGFPVEVADVAIRSMDVMALYGWSDALMMVPAQQLKGSPAKPSDLHGLLNDAALCVTRWATNGGSNPILSMVFACLVIAEVSGFDIAEMCRLKMAYNSTRPPKHGKEF